MIMDASSCSPFGNDVFIGGPECSSVDGLAAVIASCPPLAFQGNLFPGLEDASGAAGTHVGGCRKRGLYSVLDVEETGDEEFSDEVAAHQVEKKRRLSVEQVKALEKNFEMENKLEPERKIQLARELGLQPRQVAVWFQNRRARWKTKQLEKDYDLLKSEYDDLKSSYMEVAKDKDLLQSEVARLQERLAQFKSPQATMTTSPKVKSENNSEDSEHREQLQTCGVSSLNRVCRKDQGSLSSESDASEVLEADSNPAAHYHSSGAAAIVAAGFLLHDQDCFHHYNHQTKLRAQFLKAEEGGAFQQDHQSSGGFSWPWD